VSFSYRHDESDFLKRLESSINSFAITMERTVKKIERWKRLPCSSKWKPEIDLSGVDLADIEDEELREVWRLAKGLFINGRSRPRSVGKGPPADKEQLNLLHVMSRDITPKRDAKLAELKKLIGDKVNIQRRTRLGKPNVRC